MTGNDDAGGPESTRYRVPGPLRERVDELFVAERGYEPASFQEALSLVVDVAEAGTDSDGPGAVGPPTRRQSASPDSTDADGSDESSESNSSGHDEDPSADGSRNLSEATIESSEFEAVSFDEYVDGLDRTGTDPASSVESIVETAHADGVVRELAAELLDEMTEDAFEELEHGVDQGVGAGVADGMGSTTTAEASGTAPSGSQGDGVPDSLTADPDSDCAVCGRARPVSVLTTTILEEEGGSVALVCPGCEE